MLNSITPIIIEYNCWNGLIFQILNIEASNMKFETTGNRFWEWLNCDNALFGINFCSTFLIIDFLFFKITVFDKNKEPK